MASVWKRLQRVNKRAAKFQYTASYHRVDLETTPKWKPNKLSVVWTRRSRRVVTDPLEWEPSLKDPLKGSVIYPVPENRTVAVTLFKDSRTNELEDKDWTFVLEDVSVTGKRRRLALCCINMRKYASLEPSQRGLTLTLEPVSHKIAAATLTLTLHCVLLREGQATDEDMQSLASLLSVNNNSDIAVLEDLDEDDCTFSDNSTRQMLNLRQQVEEMTQSLTNSDVAATPNSVQSLNFDNSRTPTAPMSPEAASTPVPEDPPPTLTNFTNINYTNYIKPEPKPPQIDTSLDLKPIVFKPKTIAKRNLKPLELKTNLNDINLDRNDEMDDDSDKTPTADMERLFPGKIDKDKTPVQDLLEWCQSVTREYKSCRVTNLTTSFRSGLAFCAIIHRFRPDLIDFSGLQPDEAETNLRTALEASGTLGIPQVLTAADVCARAAPDKLAIMTYLFQLRAHFTGSELQVEQLGNDETESSYLVGRHDTDCSLPPELFSREVSARRSRADRTQHAPRPASSESQDIRLSQTAPVVPPNGSPARDVRGLLLHQSKALLGKVLSPARDPRPSAKWFADPLKLNEPPPARPEKLMTRKELTDPFGSDDEEDPPPETQNQQQQNVVQQNVQQQNQQVVQNNGNVEPEKEEQKPPTIEPAITDPLTQPEERVEEQTQELPKPAPPMTEEERQAMLRERARKLIADARAGIVSPTSPLSPSRSSRGGTVEIISKQSVMEELAAAGGVEQLDALLSRTDSIPSSPGSRKGSVSPDRSEEPHSEDTKSVKSVSPTRDDSRRSPLHSFSALVDRLTPDKDLGDEGGACSYLAGELAALEREQRAVDARAKTLETRLRAVMDAGRDPHEEDRLMSQWFNLVNKKNALLRRQMQLNILEQEEDLSRRCELLARELRLSLGVDEWRKTPGQKRRERLLLQELLSAVNERDRLVQEMDEQERAIADDDEIERNLSQVEIQRKNNCILQ
ncbi:EH domain-binding protein 1 isoform X2 [Manduca sexta]|uniref:EH domain-binding protein 1 isoform X2 n=1 Tax=Manduca sexta TaxID=7130 RepID=UPI0011840820|nr:EH domain-binding protein 1 isoform X2 [Manduca sexta]